VVPDRASGWTQDSLLGDAVETGRHGAPVMYGVSRASRVIRNRIFANL